MNRNLKLAAAATATAVALGAGAATAGNFDGAYLGLYGSGDFSTTPNTYGIGVQGGYTFEFAPGGYAGIEADANYQFGGAPSKFAGLARLGYDFNSPVMIFAKGGVGYDTTGTSSWVVGAGAQYEIFQGTSIRADYERWTPTGGGAADNVVKVGLNYNF